MKSGSRPLRWVWCAETEKGVYFGAIEAINHVRAEALIRQYLLNLTHMKIEQLIVERMDLKEHFHFATFDVFTEEGPEIVRQSDVHGRP